MLRKRLAMCFTLGMIAASASATKCWTEVSGENPDGTCIYNVADMTANARAACRCQPGIQWGGTCQRTCLQNPEAIPSEECDNHCTPPCPVFFKSECGSCADFQGSCGDAFCSSCQSCL